MNDDRLLHCLLKHKAIVTSEESRMYSLLNANNIVSGDDERAYCLKKKFLIHSVAEFENALGGTTAMAQISVSPSGETEIKRLWRVSRYNKKYVLLDYLKEHWIGILTLIVALLGLVLQYFV